MSDPLQTILDDLAADYRKQLAFAESKPRLELMVSHYEGALMAVRRMKAAIGAGGPCVPVSGNREGEGGSNPSSRRTLTAEGRPARAPAN